MYGYYGLIGNDIQLSLSPFIHRFFFDYDYELFEIDSEEKMCEKILAKDYDGLNVTIPYKKSIIPLLDQLSPLAEKIGSVNTVLNCDGMLLGYNTDYYGFLKTLERVEFNPENKKCLILGSGGASLSIRQALSDRKAEVIVISRKGEDNYDNISRHYDASLIVNTTPVGKYPNMDESPLSLDGFGSLQAVVDINYIPLRSRLLLEAQEKGARILDGLTMLVWQAKKSAELFTSDEVPDEKAEDVEKMLRMRETNFVFIGMPSCGKTTVGVATAKIDGREFIDTDELIEKNTGRIPAEIITEDGEEFFREVESVIIKSLEGKVGCVISLGGGAVLKKENVDLLKKMGILIYLDRPLDELISDGRPLSKNIEQLYAKRKPLYEAAADITVKSKPTAEETAKEVCRLVEKYF